MRVVGLRLKLHLPPVVSYYVAIFLDLKQCQLPLGNLDTILNPLDFESGPARRFYRPGIGVHFGFVQYGLEQLVERSPPSVDAGL
jgi:hypothetical protein